ncbi:condensation domain-containing protein [Streptomyces sp. NPDC048277]|uniref:condensation domain-containing protein n=1 Tax=Streptomyces sp. NPDC048277 TaxID=3155027 RepID=UPI00340D7979
MSHPMSVFQQTAVRMEQLSPGYLAGPRAVLTVLVDITGPLDTRTLDAAFDDLVMRHAVLRTHPVPGTTHAEIRPAGRTALEPVDSTGVLEDDLRAMTVLLDDTTIDLARPVLARGFLLTHTAERHLLGLACHHFAVDPTSLRLALGELAALYTARLRGRRLPPVPLPYSEYVRRQAVRLGARADGDRAAWHDALADIRVPAYERDRPFHPGAAADGRVLRAELLDNAGVETVLAWSRRHRSTVFITLLAAYVLTLRARSRRDDLIVTTVFEQRDHPAVRNLIGPFLYPTVLPLRVRPGRRLTEDFVTVLRGAVLHGYEHARFPVLDMLGIAPHLAPGILGLEPSWYRMFEYLPSRDTTPYAFAEAGATVVYSAGNQDDAGRSGHSLRVRRSSEGALMARIGYDANDDNDDTVVAFLDTFRSHLSGLEVRARRSP